MRRKQPRKNKMEEVARRAGRPAFDGVARARRQPVVRASSQRERYREPP